MDDDWNNWKKLFDLVGVTEDQMLTKGTLDFLYCFVRKRGGVDNVIRELQCDPLAPTGNYHRTGLKSSFHALLIFFTITTEIHARSLANFYCRYADRHMMNLI